MTKPIPDDVVLPCGCVVRCRIVDDRKEMQMIPCRMDCRNLLNALELASEADRPVEYRTAP